MIILNGKKFAENNKEAIKTLFDPEGTFVGFYKRNKNSITLYDHQMNRIGGINHDNVLFKTTKQADGTLWHSYATIEQIGPYNSWVQQCEEVREALHHTTKGQNNERTRKRICKKLFKTMV